MRYIPLLIGALAFAAPAKADKFWLSDPAAEAKAAEGSSPDILTGVLLGEEDGVYRIRVVGGEVRLQKARVFKVEKDDLTVEAIAQAEENGRAAGEQANRERVLTQAEARRFAKARAADASTRRRARAVEAVAPRSAPVEVTGFDPVLGVATRVDPQIQMMIDAEIAWSLTKNRRYLKLLRQLRRLR